MLGNFAAKLKQPLRQGGDTIVEVLIAITVLSMILGGAYVTTNTSLLDTRDAQERSNATKLVQAQFEDLRSAAATNSAVVFGATLPGSFCMTSGSNTPLASSSASCKVDTTGAAAPSTTQPRYSLVDKRAQTSAGGLTYYTFSVTATWSTVRQNGTQDFLQMSYRLDQQ